MLVLSEQQIVDCSGLYGNFGCDGGMYSSGWQYAKNYALEASTDYPYVSGGTGTATTCTYNAD